jgi:hypothetical protein
LTKQKSWIMLMIIFFSISFLIFFEHDEIVLRDQLCIHPFPINEPITYCVCYSCFVSSGVSSNTHCLALHYNLHCILHSGPAGDWLYLDCFMYFGLP